MSAGTVVLWRHGRTAWNAEHRLQGATDIPLDDVGRWQIGQAAQGLSERHVPDRVVTSDLERAIEIAEVIAKRPPIAVRLTKEVALAGADAPLATGLMLERRAFETLCDTHDQKEGMQAFLERRNPSFNGN